MIELIAQATPQTAQPLTVGAIFSGLIALLGAARILYILDGDLKCSQDVMSDPIGFAVKNSATYDDIRADKWRGLRAVFVAHQMEEYMTRFGWFLRTNIAYGVCCAVACLFLILFVYAGVVAPGSSGQNYVLWAAGAIFSLWTVLIEKCKSLKKSIELLRVT